MSERVLVVVPTYNEAENVETILRRLTASVPTAHALVVDDGSPDGTGDLVAAIAATDDRIHLMRPWTESANAAGPSSARPGRS